MKVFYQKNGLLDEPLFIYEKDLSYEYKIEDQDLYENTEFHNSKYFIGAKYTNIENINISESPTMFLDFSELNIFNKDELKKFIKHHGFLGAGNYSSNFPILNKYLFDDQKKLSKQSHESNETIYCEPLALWISFQRLVRRLIRFWRTVEYYQEKNSNTLLDININVENKDPLILGDVENKKTLIYMINGKLIYGVIDRNSLENDLPKNLFNKIDVNEHYNARYNSLFESRKIPEISNNKIINFMYDYLISELDHNQSKNLLTIETIGRFEKKFSTLMRSSSLDTGNNLVYKNLMGSVISQLAESVANGKAYKRCLECQGWIESSTQGRLGKIYCHNNCRAKAQRRRDNLKILYEGNSAQGKLSLKNQINEFCKAFNAGPEKFLAWEKEFSEQMKNMPKSKSVLTNVRYNILNNLRVWTSRKTIAEHLDISENFLKKIDTLEAFKVVYSIPKHDVCYNDWDLHSEE